MREWRSVCCGTWRAARLAEGSGPRNAERSAGLPRGVRVLATWWRAPSRSGRRYGVLSTLRFPCPQRTGHCIPLSCRRFRSTIRWPEHSDYGVYGYPAPSCCRNGPWTCGRRLVPIGDRYRPGGSSHALSRPSVSPPMARQPLLALESEYTRLWPTRRNANWSRWCKSWPIQVEESARQGGQDRQRMGRRHPAYLRRICARVPNKSNSGGRQIRRGMGRHRRSG